MAEKARREEEARAAALEVEAGRATQEKAAAADAAHQRARASRAQASTETCGPHAVGPADEALDEDKSDSESAEDGNEGENQDEEKNEEENVAEERGVQLSDNDAVAETIVNFNLESPKNVSSVYQSACGNTGVISATTGHVRSMVHSFPEVLQMNCSPKTNKYNYQLLSMIAMDQYGNCQPVQYSLLETNGDWHMAKRLEHFKRANEHWCFVRIVIVGKDMREMRKEEEYYTKVEIAGTLRDTPYLEEMNVVLG
ncbi:hypothetical protein PC110_g11014 [Phytophthora cactorum]|uniref:ZSWIM1/3 RNaseH-like domain-containing protein n=2 Tax=Phytophthora cactorum TaxID=29920 RepID=A0A329S7Z7_9STRA|nr:hypothetical protein PC114_g7353 [Phytophthora cactorum]KAG3175197.1 hypothetical protein C6341_g9574 [Phytophthora cactorum]RAW32660.1 hypothetical protein PC110_g11014 [Phytophthora cactorum]